MFEDDDTFKVIEDNKNFMDSPTARTTLLGAMQQAQADKRVGEMAIWEALLRQAEANRDQAQANRDQAQANREQAEANRANSHAILAHTQRVIHAEATNDMEPDRLDSWFCADGDAKDATSIAEQIVKAAPPLTAISGIGTEQVIPSAMMQQGSQLSLIHI